MHCILRRGSIAIALGVIAALSACGGGGEAGDRPGGKAKVQFAVGAGSASAKAQARAAGPSPASVMVSIEKADGERVVDQVIPVLTFGGGYVSQEVELEVGSYRLTRFVVADATNTVIYAAPNATDPSADPALLGQVQRPLPIQFQVTQAVIHTEPVEVLPVGEHTAAQFGYASFTFKIGTGWAKSARRISYSPGWDGVYGTSDDEVSSYSQVQYDEDGDAKVDAWYTAASGYGRDGVPFTSDDVPSGWWWERVKDTYGSNQNGAGEDGLWISDDDTVSSWEDFGTRSGDSNVHLLYSGPGEDGLWFTADDVISGYYQLEFNAYGAETKRVYYSSPGPDGVWMTADDPIGQDWFGAYVVNTYVGKNSRWGSWDRQVSYVGPGPDGVWFTSDDAIGTCRTHAFADGSQYWTTERSYSPGYDGVCFTADDRPSGYSTGVNSF